MRGGGRENGSGFFNKEVRMEKEKEKGHLVFEDGSV